MFTFLAALFAGTTVLFAYLFRVSDKDCTYWMERSIRYEKKYDALVRDVQKGAADE